MRNSRGHRLCSRAGCRHLASQTLTYIYADSTAVLGPLATFAEPHAYDLCEIHGAKLTAPNGWQVIRREINSGDNGPSDEDLMAIADAVREVASREIQDSNSNHNTLQSAIGRRGHLRSVPNA